MKSNQDQINKLLGTNLIKGNFCHMHHITIDDAQLIYDLRTSRKDSFLRPTPGGVEAQAQYLKNYFERFKKGEEIYYKIFDLRTQKFSGVLRLTEIKDNDEVFNWQSYVVSDGATPNMTIDAMLMVYRIGFEFLGRKRCGPWEVDKDNVRVMKLHEVGIKMAKRLGENEKYYLYGIEKADYEKQIGHFLKMNYAKLGGLQ